MDEIILDDTGLKSSKPISAKELILPDELAEWARENSDMVIRVQRALDETYSDNLTEDQLWETIASVSSPKWQTAHAELRAAEERLDDLNSPLKIGLGSIGSALDSDEMNAAEEFHSIKLADFTSIDEGLRQREDLKRLLRVLMVQRRMLDTSAQRTQQVQRDTAALGAVMPLRYDFKKAARRHKRLRDRFRAYAKRLLKPTEEKKPEIRPAPALSSLKI